MPKTTEVRALHRLISSNQPRLSSGFQLYATYAEPACRQTGAALAGAARICRGRRDLLGLAFFPGYRADLVLTNFDRGVARPDRGESPVWSQVTEPRHWHYD